MKGILIGFALAFVALVVIGIAVDEETTDGPIPAVTVQQSSLPPQPPINSKPYNQSQVVAVQQSLQALGYRPGTADGVMGANTLSAIKQFQRSEGLAATGQIDDELLDALDDAEPLASSQPTGFNMTDTWYDNYGYRVEVQQRGNQVIALSYDPYSGLQVVTSSGTFDGLTLVYQWTTANGLSGSGVGTLQSDHRHMDIIVTDASTGMVQTNRLHKGHMAGQ